MRSHRFRGLAGNAGGIPTDGLVAWYTMEDISGSTLNDETGSADVTLFNGPTQEAGYTGQSLRFDGTNDYGQGSTTETFSGGITICARFRFNGSKNSQSIFSKRDGGSGNDIQLSTNSSGALSLLLWGTSTITSTFTAASFSTGVWYYLEAKYDGSTVTIRLDDTTQTFSRTGTIDNNTSGFRLASDWFGNYAALNLDDTLIYNRALTGAESDIVRGII